MVDKTLTNIVDENPVTTALDGSEPLETVVGGVSQAARIRQLSFISSREVVIASGALLTTDQGKVIRMNSTVANIFTLRLETNVPFPINGTLLVRQDGAGATTLAFEAGVTILQKSSNSLQLSERYAQVVLHKVASNTWHVAGEFLAQ